jgi:hypothetical protein
MDQVHILVDRPGALGPPWTNTGADSGHDGVLTGARPPVAPVRQSSPAGVQQREERTGNSIRASPGLERRRGGGVTMVRGSVVSTLGERKSRARREGNVSGEGCGELRGWCSPFIGAGGAVGRGGRGG